MASRPYSARSKRLASARRLRRQVSSAEHHLSKGRTHIEDVLGTPTHVQGRMSVYRALCATPTIGETTAREILEQLSIWPTDKIYMLAVEDRKRVIELLPDRVRRQP